MKNALIVVLAGLLVFAAVRLVEIENQRYAMLVGMCPGKLDPSLPDPQCLQTVQTRTSWVWHLAYALKVL
jgi:hypothetical protein